MLATPRNGVAMPTIFTHAAVPLLLGSAAGKQRIGRRLRVAASIAAMLPDADTLGFRFGIAYADPLGHRGAMHSLLCALGMALIATLFHQRLRASATRTFIVVGLAAISHPLLDMLTDGGLGIALFWPFSERRYFFPWRPIKVSPIGARFFSNHGWPVIESELLWVWLPTSLIALALYGLRRLKDGRHSSR
jgi:inner membrane protein